MTFTRETGRRSIRLRGYDYGQAGPYFVTICTKNRAHLFGEVVGGAMVLSPPGEMVTTVWRGLPHQYDGVEVGAFVAMPDHVHGIVHLRPGAALDLPGVVHRFKTYTTKRFVDGVRNAGWPPFAGRVWQRNYWEGIIRGHDGVARVSTYIRNNPRNWSPNDHPRRGDGS